MPHAPRLLLAALAVTAAPAAAQSHLFTWPAPSAADRFGAAVALGDVDKDGYTDLVAGAPFDGKNGQGAGAVHVYSGRDGRPLFSLRGGGPGREFGRALACLPDVDGDGHADLLIGEPRAAYNGLGSGGASLRSGRTQAILWALQGNAGDEAGVAVDNLGDLDQDGTTDFVVGAWQEGGKGAARVYSGKTGTLLSVLAGDSAGDGFGLAVAGAGDVDADGWLDVIAGAPNDDNKAKDSGSARVFSGKDWRVLYTFDGDAKEEHFGAAVAGAGDLDGDGHADLLVGAPDTTRELQTNMGMVRAFSGKTGKVLYERLGASGDAFGTAVRGSADLDGDRVPDWLATAPLAARGGYLSGTVVAVSGRTGNLLFELAGNAFQTLGQSLATGGDVNGDGRPDFAAGASAMARAWSAATMPLFADVHEVSLSLQGSQRFDFDAGPSYAGQLFLLLGSMSGTRPGLRVGSITLPLNLDPYLDVTLLYPNSPMLGGSLGLLDARGRATARFTAIWLIPPSLRGTRIDHAYLVFGKQPFDFASNPVPVVLGQ